MLKTSNQNRGKECKMFIDEEALEISQVATRIPKPAIRKKKNISVICAVFTSVIILVGCSSTNKEMQAATDGGEINISIETNETEMNEQEEQNLGDEEDQVDDQREVTEMDQNYDTDNNIYNSVKYYNGYFYFSDVDGFKRMSKDQSIMETLAEGNVSLGNCDGNYIYYIRYASDAVENAGVFRMDLTKLMEEKIMDWSESMWSIYSIYSHENIVYFEESDICEAYEVIDGKANKIDEKDNLLYQQLDRCGIPHEDINALAFGYVNMMFQYHKLVYLDRQDNKIMIYSTDSEKTIKIIDQCGSDVLVGDRGIVYKDLENNVLLRKWEGEDSKLLYDISEYNNNAVNYGTFDDHYIYGFYENGDECTLVKIKWEGGCEIGRTFEDVRIAVELGFSASNGVISFLQDGHRVFENY